jgi:hypothetical protein
LSLWSQTGPGSEALAEKLDATFRFDAALDFGGAALQCSGKYSFVIAVATAEVKTSAPEWLHPQPFPSTLNLRT